jgi:hypothetical protein
VEHGPRQPAQDFVAQPEAIDVGKRSIELGQSPTCAKRAMGAEVRQCAGDDRVAIAGLADSDRVARDELYRLARLERLDQPTLLRGRGLLVDLEVAGLPGWDSHAVVADYQLRPSVDLLRFIAGRGASAREVIA